MDMTEREVNEMIISLLQAGAIQASRRPDGELGFTEFGVTPPNCDPVDTAEAIEELRADAATELPLSVN